MLRVRHFAFLQIIAIYLEMQDTLFYSPPVKSSTKHILLESEPYDSPNAKLAVFRTLMFGTWGGFCFACWVGGFTY